MNETDVGALMHDCMIVTMKLCLPILGVALIVGLFISFIQAITQINEASLAFLPKILAIGLGNTGKTPGGRRGQAGCPRQRISSGSGGTTTASGAPSRLPR